MNKSDVLKSVFGYESFRVGQEEIIESVLSGKDTLAVMPTGGGKSVCFQIPALMFDGITVVISPLISLMKDQVTSLIQNGVRAAYINGSLSEKQIAKALNNAKSGMYKIIYVAPERLKSQQFRQVFNYQKLSFLCVDEAHCVSQWGQDFRPSYLNIKEFVSSFDRRPVVCALTATATEKVRADIIRLIALQDPFVSVQSFDRKNLFFSVCKPKNKPKELERLLLMHKGRNTIVYCSTRKKVDMLYLKLLNEGYSVSRYHAGMTKDERKENQDKFIKDECEIMIATNAFGMGIDKSNVTMIIHYNMPGDIESYYQEAGRAGRDGSFSLCVLLFNEADIRTQRYFIENSDENDGLTAEERKLYRSIRKERLYAMIDYAQSQACLRKYILNYFGEEAGDNCAFCSNCAEAVSAFRNYTPSSNGKTGLTSDYDENLFNVLKTLRKKIAKEKKVPAFIVFTDSSLKAMSTIKPLNEQEFLSVPGVGKNKKELYAQQFTNEIRNYLNLLH